jgi:hypothetical protein
VAIYAKKVVHLNAYAKKNVKKFVNIINVIIIVMKYVKIVKKNAIFNASIKNV